MVAYSCYATISASAGGWEKTTKFEEYGDYSSELLMCVLLRNITTNGTSTSSASSSASSAWDLGNNNRPTPVTGPS
eukprot:1195464-Prorocentrum_minimum.AAC.4